VVDARRAQRANGVSPDLGDRRHAEPLECEPGGVERLAERSCVREPRDVSFVSHQADDTDALDRRGLAGQRAEPGRAP